MHSSLLMRGAVPPLSHTHIHTYMFHGWGLINKHRDVTFFPFAMLHTQGMYVAVFCLHF